MLLYKLVQVRSAFIQFDLILPDLFKLDLLRCIAYHHKLLYPEIGLILIVIWLRIPKTRKGISEPSCSMEIMPLISKPWIFKFAVSFKLFIKSPPIPHKLTCLIFHLIKSTHLDLHVIGLFLRNGKLTAFRQCYNHQSNNQSTPHKQNHCPNSSTQCIWVIIAVTNCSHSNYSPPYGCYVII